MGEAKRRRERANRPVEFFDIATNELRTARNAGDPVEFLEKLKALALADERGERPTANVACNGCTACCYYKEVDFDPRGEQEDDLTHLDVIPIENGRLKLKKREDGACIHLGDSGCQVYEHRPRPCRAYDCRGIALVSMVDTFDGGRHSPFWIFESHTKQGRMLKEGFRILGMIHQRQAVNSGEMCTAADTLGFALKNIGQFYSLMEEVGNMSRQQQTQLFGFDPGSVTEQDYMGMMKAMTAGMKLAKQDSE